MQHHDSCVAISLYFKIYRQISSLDLNYFWSLDESLHVIRSEGCFLYLQYSRRRIHIPTRHSLCAIQCSYGAVISIKKHRDKGYVVHFLKGLNENFSSLKSQIMMMTPLLDIDHAFSIVIQHDANSTLLICLLMTPLLLLLHLILAPLNIMVETNNGTLILEANLIPHDITRFTHIEDTLITQSKHALLSMVIHQVLRTVHEPLLLPTMF